jgi:hypothetical protein
MSFMLAGTQTDIRTRDRGDKKRAHSLSRTVEVKGKVSLCVINHEAINKYGKRRRGPMLFYVGTSWR